MKAFPKNHNVAGGSLVSPTRRAILQYLQMHGESTKEQLEAALKNFRTWRAGPEEKQPIVNAAWMGSHLANLRLAGHISKRVNAAQQTVWFAGTEPVVNVGTDFVEPDEEPAQVAKPRQVDVMFGATYQPVAWTPARSGAGAYTQIPSLIGGRRVPYRAPISEQVIAYPTQQQEEIRP